MADTDAATALARLHRSPVAPRQLRPEIPFSVEAVVLQAMARRPADRFATAAAMRTALLGAGADPGRAPAAAVAAAAANPPMAPGTPPPHAAPIPQPAPRPPAAPEPSPRSAYVPADGYAAPTDEQPARRSRRWMVVVMLIAMAALAAVFAVQQGGSDPGGSSPDPIALASATSFDPQGDNGTENEELAPNAIDGDPATAWTSERYRDADAMAGKDGVGLIVALDGAQDIGQVDLTTPEAGWSAQIYVIEGAPPGDLAGWGEPQASVDSAEAGQTRLTFAPVRGDHVLVWFTKVAPSGQATVAEITVAP